MRVISNIFYGVFVILLVSIVLLLLATFLPIPGNIEVKIVKSGSMEPTIHTGAIVVVKPQTAYFTGDIITFGKDTRTDIPTTHRILAIEGSGANAIFTTKGDANEEQDPQTVLARDVIGKVLVNVPYAGYVIDFARTKLGFALLVGVPAVVVILDEAMKIFGEVRGLKARKRQEEEDDLSSTMPPKIV